MNQTQYYVTDDTALAAYLYLKGVIAIEATLINRHDRNRKKFIFFDDDRRPELEEEFYSRTTRVVPIDYHNASVAVRRFLKTTVDDPRDSVE